MIGHCSLHSRVRNTTYARRAETQNPQFHSTLLVGSRKISLITSNPQSLSPVDIRKERSEETRPYRYSPLQGNEIRLVDLLPGAFDDDIYIRIVHEELVAPTEDNAPKQLKKQDIQQTLPEGWKVHLNLEGKWFYYHPELTGPSIVYEHPCPAHRGTFQDPPAVDATVKYEALSYAWGNTERPCVVFLNLMGANRGEGRLAALRISQNLDTTFRYLRTDVESFRTLWIDAFCINQDDYHERKARIQRMPSVYSQTRRVTVWLGPPSEDSDLAMASLETLGEQTEISPDGWYFKAVDARYSHWFNPGEELPFTNLQWQAIGNLIRISRITPTCLHGKMLSDGLNGKDSRPVTRTRRAGCLAQVSNVLPTITLRVEGRYIASVPNITSDAGPSSVMEFAEMLQQFFTISGLDSSSESGMDVLARTFQLDDTCNRFPISRYLPTVDGIKGSLMTFIASNQSTVDAQLAELRKTASAEGGS